MLSPTEDREFFRRCTLECMIVLTAMDEIDDFDYEEVPRSSGGDTYTSARFFSATEEFERGYMDGISLEQFLTDRYPQLSSVRVMELAAQARRIVEKSPGTTAFREKRRKDLH